MMFLSIELEVVFSLIFGIQLIRFDDEGQVSLEGFNEFVDVFALEPVVSAVRPEMPLELEDGVGVGQSPGCVFVFQEASKAGHCVVACDFLLLMVGFTLNLISGRNKDSHVSEKMPDFSTEMRKLSEPQNQEEVIS